MATKVLMEALSPTMEEGRLVEWKKKEGDVVAVGDVLAEVETDKAVMDLVARAGGVLLKQVIGPGTTLPVTALVGVIGNAGEDVSEIVGGAGGQGGGGSKPTPAAAPASPAAKAPAATPGAAAAPIAPAQPAASAPVNTGRLKASPLAKKVASDRGLDLASIQGSGPDGRIIVRDLSNAVAGPARPPASLPPRAGVAGAAYSDVPLSQLRKTIAKRLVASIGPVPTFYLTTEIDMERAAEAREALKALGPDGKVSFNDIIIKATALALRQNPACNAWWQDDRIRYWNEIHVSMAVAIEDGLITPVIRHADLKSLREISAESKDLAGRARERKLTPEEYTGGTFSVSNLGMFDIDQFTAIINPPEAGILAVGSVAEKAVAVGGQVMVRRRLRVTMSCDHRVIDGATGAAFLKTLKTLLENPLAMVW
jgi:pyruvate dehydrogenase E2 component (dihydrolipoamide acetyltransferase)